MYIVMGATGHVGAAVATALVERGQPVTVVARDREKAADWSSRGADIAIADVRDVEGMRAAFRRGRRAFLLNPPADPATDTDATERETIACLLAALDGSGLEKVVAQSTYGVQPGERLGDLSTLHHLETGLQAQPIPSTIQRGAYYMSNWDASLPAAEQGVLPSMLPEDLRIPMVAPDDLGQAAAHFLMEPVESTGIRDVEGPHRYSAHDAAAAFARALGRTVRVSVTPPERWETTFRELGFSEAAAHAFTRMMGVTVAGLALPDAPIRGAITLDRYIAELVARARASRG